MKQTLYVLQGPSGSGKSFVANQLMSGINSLSGIPKAGICSTDNYFHENGIYQFKVEKLGENHEKCLEYAKSMMAAGFTCILDNTNIKCWECRDYVKWAVSCDIPVVFIRVTGNFKNVHGVPGEVVQKQRERMEDLTIEKVLASQKSVWRNNNAEKPINTKLV